MNARHQRSKVKRSLKKVADPVMRERLLMVLAAYEHPSLREASQHCGKSHVTVKHWKDQYEQSGLKGLHPTPKTGRPKKLTPSKEIAIKQEVLAQSASQSWQVKQVKEYIRKESGISYSIRHTTRIMQSWGLVQLVPRPRYAHAQESERIAFLKGKH